jgi:hypothetical protein
MVLPFSTLKFGAHDVEIEEMDHAESDEREAFGQFNGKRFRIRVQVVGIPRRKVAQTTLHEVMHAVYWFWDLHADDAEERVVTKMAHGLAAVFRDNPVFSQWLVAELA